MTLAERLSQLNWGGEGFPAYEGRLDRAAQSMARSAEREAENTAAQERQNAASERAMLLPFYRQEMNAQHLYNPEQTNELLNYAGSATGGSGATAMGQAASEAARTRNTSGFTSVLDKNARDRAAEMSKANLGIGAQDIMGAKELNREGAAGMMGLEGLDTRSMLEAMGQRANDINAYVNAGKSGWFQNMLDTIQTLTGAGNASANMKKAGMF